MPVLSHLFASGSRLLARRLDQLGSTLESVRLRLRRTIANAIGETIGALVHDAAWGFLNACEPNSFDSRQGPRYLHENFEAEEYESDGPDYWIEDQEDDAISPVNECSTAPDRLPPALSAGLQMAAWWLRFCSNGGRLWTTFAVGLFATSLAFLGGPVAIALLHVIGSASHFGS